MPNPKQILITDRNSHVRDLLRRELAREGFTVFAAASGLELESLLDRGGTYDLILLDLDMPLLGTDGLAEKLAARAEGTPMIMHTYFLDDLDERYVYMARLLVEKDGDTGNLLEAMRFCLAAADA